MLSPCLFILQSEYITGNAGLNEAQAGIRIARRNNSNLRYANTAAAAAAAAAAAKSLQSCLTLCDPIDDSPPGSPIHGIFQARVLERVAIAFSRYADDTHPNGRKQRGAKEPLDESERGE